METDPLEARAALKDAAAAEQRSALLAKSTWLYEAWFGVNVAGCSALFALNGAQTVLLSPLSLVLLTSIFGLRFIYHRATGSWVPFLGGSWRVFIVMCVVVIASCATSYLLASTCGLGWWLAIVAVATAVTTALLIRRSGAVLTERKPTP